MTTPVLSRRTTKIALAAGAAALVLGLGTGIGIALSGDPAPSSPVAPPSASQPVQQWGFVVKHPSGGDWDLWVDGQWRDHSSFQSASAGGLTAYQGSVTGKQVVITVHGADPRMGCLLGTGNRQVTQYGPAAEYTCSSTAVH